MKEFKLNWISAFMLRKRLAGVQKKLNNFCSECCVGSKQDIDSTKNRCGVFDRALHLYELSMEAIAELSALLEQRNCECRGILAEMKIVNDAISTFTCLKDNLNAPMFRMERNPVSGEQERIDFVKISDVDIGDRITRLQKRKIVLEDELALKTVLLH